MVGKFIVNHCVRSVYAGVGLFHMYSEGILVDGHSESEGGNFAVYMQDASGQSQFFKIVEGVDQCATFVARSFMLVAIVGLTPFGFQVQTFLDAVGSDGSIFVIIGAFEFVDMIPFGLEFLSGKRGEVCTQIEVIGIVPVCCELEFSGRYDGTSRLATGNQWGFMPSAAVGWQMKNENFLKNVDWLNSLKLRVSWGKSGNNSIDHDITWTKLDLTHYIYGGKGENAFGLGDRKGNKDLRWEMTSEWNYGIDFGFLNNRINGTIDVYNRTTKDLIFARSVGNLNGYGSILENIGTSSNKGVEIGLNTVNISKKDFTWKTNLTFSLNRNKIVDLYGDKKDDLANRWFIGQPMKVIYDLEKVGIWQTEDKELAAKYGQVPGHIRVADLDENYVIDERDYKVLGSPSPDWTAGMTNTFTYKNWDLSFYMYARIGGTYNDDFTYMFTAWDNEHWNKLNVKYWTPENHSNEYQQIGAQSYHTQVLGKISGSFLKIQNITLGYTLPENWMKKMKMKNARAYINVQNPFTFTDYLGPDPETIGEDVYKSLSLYPMTFTFGVNLTF